MRRSTPVSLLEVFPDDEHHGPRSNEWLRRAFHQRTILISNPVYAELAPAFDSREALDEALREISASISPVDTEIAYEAGRRWLRYRQAGGSRKRIITDFLIGAHALAAAEIFLTRDRGFYATYFPELTRP